MWLRSNEASSSSVCISLEVFTLLAPLLPSFPPPCVHPCGHVMSLTCSSVQSSEGGISLRQMVNDVALIFFILTTLLSSTCPSPLALHLHQAKYRKLLIHRIHIISWVHTFSAWLGPVGIKPQKPWQFQDCSGHTAWQPAGHEAWPVQTVKWQCL